MVRLMWVAWVLWLSLVGGPLVGWAATINAANCTASAVQTAINSASPGDTVHLPTCTQSWDTTVTISTDNLIVEGNGTANTVLNRVASGEWAMFEVNGVTGFEMRYLTLDGAFDTNPNQLVDTGVHLVNTVVDFRLHHMTFSDLAEGVRVTGDPTVQRGVIDHNTFLRINYAGGPQGSFGYGVVVFGNGTYPALSLGTATNVFIEDNTFQDSREATDANDGARYVFRYNTSLNNGENAAHVATHGWCPTCFFDQGTRQIEVYNNSFSNSVPKYGGVAVWGGDGVIFNNTFGADISEDIQLRHQDCGASYPYQGQIRALYLWNNTLTGGGPAEIYNGCTALVQLNRDYFLAVRPGYTSYTYPHPATTAATDPTIAITAPTSSDTWSQATTPLTTLAGTATDDVDITSITWSCPGCTGSPSGSATCTPSCGGGSNTSVSWTVASIPLAVGSGNVITVTVSDGITTATDTLTVTRGVTVTVDSTFAGYSSAVIDDGVINATGGPATTWASAESTVAAHDVVIDFGTAQTFGSATIYWAFNSDASAYMTSNQVQVQSWNGSTYSTIATMNYAGDVASTQATFTPVSTSRLRFLQQANQGNPAYPEVMWLTEIDYGAAAVAPVATITAPTSAATFSTGTTPLTTLAGTATDDVGVTSVTWACPTCTPTSGTATCATCGASATSVSWSVSSIGLAVGANVLTVTATDGTLTGTDTLTVTLTPAAVPILLRLVR